MLYMKNTYCDSVIKSQILVEIIIFKKKFH